MIFQQRYATLTPNRKLSPFTKQAAATLMTKCGSKKIDVKELILDKKNIQLKNKDLWNIELAVRAAESDDKNVIKIIEKNGTQQSIIVQLVSNITIIFYSKLHVQQVAQRNYYWTVIKSKEYTFLLQECDDV